MRTTFFLRTLSIAAIAMTLAAPAAAAIPLSERQALTTLYTATHGGSWTQRSNWCSGSCGSSDTPSFNAAGTECSWYGVTCDETGSHVVELGLPGNNLGGTLPAQAALAQLRYWSVAGNHIGGSLPSLAGLSQLRSVYFDANAFTGGLPSLAGLSNLEEFSAADNQLGGGVPSLSGLTHLVRLGLARNALTGGFPALTGLSALRELDLSGNRLDGTLGALSPASHLLVLNLAGDGFSGSLPSLAGNAELYRVEIGGNRLSGAIPAAPASLYAVPGLSISTLCPNSFTLTPSANDAGWNAATDFTPWWATPFSNNACDDLFFSGFQ